MRLAKLNGEPEIFFSLQGEGVSSGVPAVFVRTSFCNLHCVWCDTDYTWNWVGTPYKHVNDGKPGYQKFKKDELVTEATVDEVVEVVQRHTCRRVILTGGEPMLQQDELCQLMKALHDLDANYLFEIETNGTLVPTDEFDKRIGQYNVSPKLENSENAEHLRIVEKPLRFFANSIKAYYKFVVACPEDLTEVLGLVEAYQFDRSRVLLMPEGADAETLRQRACWVAHLCMEYGFRYCERLHVHLFGTERGT